MPSVTFLKDIRPFSRINVVTANTTLTAADNGTMIISNGSGAVTHTLPTLAPNLAFWFYNAVNQDMTVRSATSNNIVSFNNIGATTVVFNTAGQKTGACLFVFSNAAGTLWNAISFGPHTIVTTN